MRGTGRGLAVYRLLTDQSWGKIMSSDVRPLRRVPSGVKGLDEILHGGFFGGGLYIVEGPPGVGQDDSRESNLLQSSCDGKQGSVHDADRRDGQSDAAEYQRLEILR